MMDSSNDPRELVFVGQIWKRFHRCVRGLMTSFSPQSKTILGMCYTTFSKTSRLADIRCVNAFITLYFLTIPTVYQITISSIESSIKNILLDKHYHLIFCLLRVLVALAVCLMQYLNEYSILFYSILFWNALARRQGASSVI